MYKSMHAMGGGYSKHTFAYDGGRGRGFNFHAYILTEWPLLQLAWVLFLSFWGEFLRTGAPSLG